MGNRTYRLHRLHFWTKRVIERLQSFFLQIDVDEILIQKADHPNSFFDFVYNGRNERHDCVVCKHSCLVRAVTWHNVSQMHRRESEGLREAPARSATEGSSSQTLNRESWLVSAANLRKRNHAPRTRRRIKSPQYEPTGRWVVWAFPGITFSLLLPLLPSAKFLDAA
jgi:hypothetical protein